MADRARFRRRRVTGFLVVCALAGVPGASCTRPAPPEPPPTETVGSSPLDGSVEAGGETSPTPGVGLQPTRRRCILRTLRGRLEADVVRWAPMDWLSARDAAVAGQTRLTVQLGVEEPPDPPTPWSLQPPETWDVFADRLVISTAWGSAAWPLDGVTLACDDPSQRCASHIDAPTSWMVAGGGEGSAGLAADDAALAIEWQTALDPACIPWAIEGSGSGAPDDPSQWRFERSWCPDRGWVRHRQTLQWRALHEDLELRCP